MGAVSQGMIVLAVGLLVTLFSLLYTNRDMCLDSFVIATGARLVTWDIRPKNDTISLERGRAVSAMANYLFTPGYSKYDIVHVDQFISLYIVRSTVLNSLTTDRPVLIWFHGGGFVEGHAELDLNLCQKLADISNYVVISVNYRLAPEHPFPAAPYDAIKSLFWILENIAEYGGNINKIVVGGESAGGNIATALVASYIDSKVKNRIQFKGLITVYPCLDHGVYTDSHFRYRNTNGMLSLIQMQWYWALYLGDNQSVCGDDFRACPARTPNNILKQFPRTSIILAKYDVLLDEGIDFVNRLKENDVNADYTIYNDTIHGFFGRPIFGQSGIKAIEEFGRKLNEINDNI
jgi:acetyl esterase